MNAPHPVMAVIVLAQATASAPAQEAKRATALFMLVLLALAVLLAAVVTTVLVMRIRRRQMADPAKPSRVLVDPWSEAARRVQPFESRDQGEGRAKADE